MFPPDPSFLGMSRTHLAGWLSVFVVGSVAAVWIWGPTDWGVVRILLGGTLLGAMSFYMLFINRLLVS